MSNRHDMVCKMCACTYAYLRAAVAFESVGAWFQFDTLTSPESATARAWEAMRLWPLLLASCAAAPHVATDLDRAGPPVETRSLATALESTASKILAAAVAPWTAERVAGSVKVLHGRTHCEVASWIGVLPMVWPRWREPVVGEPVDVEWTTLAAGAPREWPCVVLASVQDTEAPPSIDLTALGLTGCWLHVDLSRVLWLWPGPADSIVHRPVGDEGRVQFRWTPTADYVGRTVVAQLVVVVPRDVAQSGFLISPGIALTVGRR